MYIPFCYYLNAELFLSSAFCISNAMFVANTKVNNKDKYKCTYMETQKRNMGHHGHVTTMKNWT